MADVMTILSATIGLYQVGAMFKKSVQNLFSSIEPHQRELFNCYNKAFKEVTGLNLKKEGLEGQITILNSMDVYFENTDEFKENIEGIEKNLIELFGIDRSQYDQIALRFEENLKTSNSYSILLNYVIRTLNTVSKMSSESTETNLLVKDLVQNLITKKKEIEFSYSKKQYAQVPDYLFRKVISKKDLESHTIFGREEYENTLINLLSSVRHIVLLSNAGEGKTTELKFLANYTSKYEIELFPVLVTLNTYIDDKIEELIQSEWEEFPGIQAFPHDKLLLIFDGFDEIQAKDKENFRRRISSFSNKHPRVHIVISSRTNFYTNPQQNTSGTISDFEPYYLTKLNYGQIRDYLLSKQQKYSFDEIDKFRKENFDSEFLSNPFNLVNFANYINENECLPESKASIFDFLIQNSIKYDINKYKNKEDELNTKIIMLLNRLAIIMERLCRNYLTKNELEKIVPDVNDLKLLNYSTLWDRHYLKFIHNNFQEYLVAKELSKLKFEDIRKLITFPPENSIIIPSWSNTISFLINILEENDNRLKTLLDLIIKSSPEIIIKAEPGQINEQFRSALFIQLFNKSKKEMLYFRVNYATHWELVRFCETSDIVKFLIDEVNDKNTYRSRYSALRLLKYIDNYFIYEEKLINLVLDFIEKDEDENIISSSLDIITKTKLIKKVDVQQIILQFQDSDSDLVRTSLLKLIDAYNFTDKYVGVILLSIESATKSFVGYSDDGKVHSIDLDITLKEVIKNMKTESSVLLLLNWFKDNQRNIHRDSFTGDILDYLISASIDLFNEESNTIYDEFTEFFKNIFTDLYGKEYTRFLRFYIQTNTHIQLVESVLLWIGNNHFEFQKIDILYQLMKDSLFDDIFSIIYSKFINNEIDKEFLHRLLHQFRASQNKNLNKIHSKLLEIDYEYFKINEQHDWAKIREEVEIMDFNNILNIEYWKAEIVKIYNMLETDEIKERKLSRLYTFDHNEKVSKSAHDYLFEIARTESIPKKRAIEILESRFDWIVINKFYIAYKNDEMPKLDTTIIEEQIKWITMWCNDNIIKVQYKQSLSSSKTGYRKNIIASYIEFFMIQFKLTFSYKNMLDMLYVVTDLETFNYITLSLENQSKKAETRVRVKSNIKNKELAKPVLQNHIAYCSVNGIVDVLPICYSILVENDTVDVFLNDLKKSAFVAVNVLNDDNYAKLKEVIGSVNDGFEWDIIEYFIEKKIELEFVIVYLANKTKSSDNDTIYKASRELIKMQRIEGIEALRNYLLKTKKWNQMYYREDLFKNLTEPFLIDSMMELLNLYLIDDIQDADKYDSFISNIQKGLSSLAIQSEMAFQRISQDIKSFVKEYSGKGNDNKISILNFYLNNLKEEYYRNKQNNITLDDIL